MWWGDPAQVYARLNGDYIQASKAVSQYADVHPTDQFLDSVIQSVPPMGRGDQQKHMGDTGAQAGIGPLPRWTTTYLVSMDRRAYRWMLANTDAAGSYNAFYRDQDTGRPVSLRDYPYMTLKGHYSDTRNPKTGEHEAFPACGGDCDNPYRANWAHEPAVGYLAYMVTGDFYYLEQLQFWADWDIFQANPHSRDAAKGLVKKGQVRGQAWNLRDLANAAYITPDNAPLKSYFVDMVDNNIAWYNQRYTDNANANKLRFLSNRAIIYDNHSHHAGTRVRMAPWQDDFFTWTIGHLADLGFDGAKRFLRWKAGFVVGRMTKPFCWIQASNYTLRVRDGDRTTPIYESFAEVYDKSFSDELKAMSCGGSEMAGYLNSSSDGNDYEPGDMTGFPWSPTGYPANMQPALAAAVDSGITRSAIAWNRYEQRPTKQNYGNNANFAVIPRSKGGTQPPRIGFYASPNPVPVGEYTELHWAAIGANKCSLDDVALDQTAGSKRIGPVDGAKTHTLRCTGPAGRTSSEQIEVTDTTIQPPSVNLAASPETVTGGQRVVLTWKSEHVKTCSAGDGPWSGTQPVKGQITTEPVKKDTKFGMDCQGPGGDARAAVTVHVRADSTDVNKSGDAGTDTGKKDAKEENGVGGMSAFILFYLALGVITIRFLRRRKSLPW